MISRPPPWSRHLAAAAGAALLLVATMLMAGRGHAGYDLDYALYWGHQIASGQGPDFSVPVAPTPHPLANAVAGLLSPLGRARASDVFVWLIQVSFIGMAVAAYAVTRRAFGVLPALLAATLLVTRPSLLSGALRGSIDIPALALSLLALALLIGSRRRWTAALAALTVAGLLRPEVWLLSASVVAWAWVDHHDPRRTLRLAALAALAPAIWCATDLVLTRQPFYSLTATRGLAEELDRPRSAVLAPILVPGFMTAILGLTVLLAGTVALAGLAPNLRGRIGVLVAAMTVSLAGFAVAGAFGLPLLARYLFFPAAILAILAAGAAAPAPPPNRWAAGRSLGMVCAALLLCAIPGTIRGLADTWGDAQRQHELQAQLTVLAEQARFRRAVARCAPLVVASYRLRPDLANAGDLDAAAISDRSARGTLVLPRTGRAISSLVSPSDLSPPVVSPPRGFRLLPGAGTADWAVATTCPAVD